MFTGHQITVEVAFEAAAARLTRLLHQGALSDVCEGAYEGGLAMPLRATLTVPLRWEATGAAGELFPVLDADLTMARHGADQTLLMLTGTYRPPFGRAGALLDRAILSRIATATIRSLLHGLAAAITSPGAAAPAPAAAAPAAAAPRPAIEAAGP
jgi:hypothetical protein